MVCNEMLWYTNAPFPSLACKIQRIELQKLGLAVLAFAALQVVCTPLIFLCAEAHL